MIAFGIGLKFKIQWTMVRRFTRAGELSLILAFLASHIRLMDVELDIPFAVGVDPYFHDGPLRSPDSPPVLHSLAFSLPPYWGEELRASPRSSSSWNSWVVLRLRGANPPPVPTGPPDGVSHGRDFHPDQAVAIGFKSMRVGVAVVMKFHTRAEIRFHLCLAPFVAMIPAPICFVSQTNHSRAWSCMYLPLLPPPCSASR
jgi:hypothetical protein